MWRGMAGGVWCDRLGFLVLGRGEGVGCDGPELVGVRADLDVPDETLFHERLPRASWFRDWSLGLRCFGLKVLGLGFESLGVRFRIEG